MPSVSLFATLTSWSHNLPPTWQLCLAIHDPACYRAVFSRGGVLRVGRSLHPSSGEIVSEWVVTLTLWLASSRHEVWNFRPKEENFDFSGRSLFKPNVRKTSGVLEQESTQWLTHIWWLNGHIHQIKWSTNRGTDSSWTNWQPYWQCHADFPIYCTWKNDRNILRSKILSVPSSRKTTVHVVGRCKSNNGLCVPSIRISPAACAVCTSGGICTGPWSSYTDTFCWVQLWSKMYALGSVTSHLGFHWPQGQATGHEWT